MLWSVFQKELGFWWQWRIQDLPEREERGRPHLRSAKGKYNNINIPDQMKFIYVTLKSEKIH